MIRYLTYSISPENAGMTIFDFLRGRGYSHRMIIRLREQGGICVNGLPAITPQKLLAGETLEIRFTEAGSGEKITPVSLPFPVLYEDDDLLVISKPANMPVHPSQGNHENTLANAAAWYFSQKGEPFTFRVITRLDRDTTGLLLLARHSLSAGILSDMAARHEIRREYLAIASGLVPETCRIQVPIGRVPGSAIMRQADPDEGSPAVTCCRRLLYRPDLDFSLVRLQLETGRTHQIRVHMRHIGHPLPGDFLYNPDFRYINRQALHSFRLRFFHPITGRALSFCAPLPQDMRWILPDRKPENT